MCSSNGWRGSRAVVGSSGSVSMAGPPGLGVSSRIVDEYTWGFVILVSLDSVRDSLGFGPRKMGVRFGGIMPRILGVAGDAVIEGEDGGGREGGREEEGEAAMGHVGDAHWTLVSF